MADNTTLNAGTGGDVVRDKDRSGVKTQIVALDLNPAGSESLMAGAMPVTAGSTGGWTPWSTPNNNSNTALVATVVQVKGSAGAFGGYFIYNPNNVVAYLQVFNVATAGGVTLGTTRPTLVFGVPPSGAANLEFTAGIAMGTGIQIAATTTASGLTAPSTGLDVTVLYK